MVNEVTVGNPRGNYGFASMGYGVDGFIYGSTASGSMYRMHPESGAVQPLGFGRYAVQGVDGMLYFSDDTELFRAKLVPVVDETPPVVTVTAERAEWKPGADHPQDHLVTVTATDEYDTCIEYRINGGEWLEYGAPTLVQAEDVTVVDARATDSSGNVSELASTEFRPGRPNLPGRDE